MSIKPLVIFQPVSEWMDPDRTDLHPNAANLLTEPNLYRFVEYWAQRPEQHPARVGQLPLLFKEHGFSSYIFQTVVPTGSFKGHVAYVGVDILEGKDSDAPLSADTLNWVEFPSEGSFDIPPGTLIPPRDLWLVRDIQSMSALANYVDSKS